jgi:hypothetical protein
MRQETEGKGPRLQREMASALCPPLLALCQWFSWLASALDRRSAPRLVLLFLGAVLARGRRTVTSWIRAAKLSDRFQSCYIAVAAAGKRSDHIARRLLTEVVTPLVGGAVRLTLALDDTPTKRYEPHVQGAGTHHNPAPSPAGSPYVYGHVVLALLVIHQAWGTIALPLLARLYVCKKDLPTIDAKHRPAFRPELELAVELLQWARPWLGLLKKPIWGSALQRPGRPRRPKSLGCRQPLGNAFENFDQFPLVGRRSEGGMEAGETTGSQ